MATSLTQKGLNIDGTTISSVPFMYNYVQGSSTSITSGWTTHMTTPDWQLPPKSKAILYFYFPQRNDNGSWGGGYCRVEYRIDSGGWVDLGHSGYSQADTVMSYNGAGRIDSQCQSMSFNFSDRTSNFTVAFRFAFQYYDGNGAVVGSCDCTTGGNTTYTVYHNASGGTTNYGGNYSVSHVCLMGQGYNS